MVCGYLSWKVASRRSKALSSDVQVSVRSDYLQGAYRGQQPTSSPALFVLVFQFDKAHLIHGFGFEERQCPYC
jgi:hypothetical protein